MRGHFCQSSNFKDNHEAANKDSKKASSSSNVSLGLGGGSVSGDASAEEDACILEELAMISQRDPNEEEEERDVFEEDIALPSHSEKVHRPIPMLRTNQLPRLQALKAAPAASTAEQADAKGPG